MNTIFPVLALLGALMLTGCGSKNCGCKSQASAEKEEVVIDDTSDQKEG